jgi:hypothetical protein
MDKPVYEVNGKKFTLKDYGSLKVGEEEKIKKGDAVDMNEVFAVLLEPLPAGKAGVNGSDKLEEGDLTTLTWDQVGDLFAEIMSDFHLSRQSFLARLGERSASLLKQKSTQKKST